jgi:PAS domain S-box-containing protein
MNVGPYSRCLRWLLAAAACPMLAVGNDGRVALANAAAEQLFGHAPGALEGRTLADLLPGAPGVAEANRAGAFAGWPAGTILALTARHAEGGTIPVEASLTRLNDGSPDGMVLATIHDTGVRRRAEQALQESEARMRAIFETAVDAILTIDAGGAIERVNPAAERMFGYREAELAGRNVAMLMPEPYRSLHNGYLDHYLATGERRIIGSGREVQGLRRDGTVFPMELAVAGMRLGERRMFTGLVRDITARKAAEEDARRLLHELTAANEELTSFAYVVSHDLKAPLRGIAALADWIASDHGHLFDDAGREHMRLLIGRVHRMGALIDGILEYSRVGRVRESRSAIDLGPVLAEVIDMVAAGSGVTVTVAPGMPSVRAEPTRIRQVFHNLLSNAVRYMDKPDGRVSVDWADQGAHWRFTVADNGPGIEPRHYERIFGLFQTLAPRDRIESTGVGLALVKKIVEMYGGVVAVSPTPGGGATFSFTLPKGGEGGIREQRHQADPGGRG